MKISNILLIKTKFSLITLLLLTIVLAVIVNTYFHKLIVENPFLSIIILTIASTFYTFLILFTKFKEIIIDKDGIHYQEQKFIYYLLNLKKKSEFINYSYLQELDIIHGIPNQIVLRFFKSNGHFKILKFKTCVLKKENLIEFDINLKQKMWGIN